MSNKNGTIDTKQKRIPTSKMGMKEQENPLGALAVLGYARRINPDLPNTTLEAMAEIREYDSIDKSNLRRRK